MPRLVLLLAALFSARPALADPPRPTGDAIVEEASRVPQPATAIAHLLVTLVNRKGEERIRDMTVYRKDEGDWIRRLVVFHAPADIRGIAYLQKARRDGSASEQFLYQPELRRFRRMAPTERQSSFMGSDFTHQDLEPRGAGMDTHRLLREDLDREDPCWVVENVPKSLETSTYARSLAWIRKDNLLPVRIELYDRGGALSRILTAEEIRREGRYWIAVRTRMRDVQKDHQTVIEVLDIKPDVEVDDAVFTEQFLARQ